MFDERAFIMLVELADVDEFAEMVTNPSSDEEKALRAHLGDQRYRRLHALALKRGLRPAKERRRGNVVVIHGVMGSALTAFDHKGLREQIWPNAHSIAQGHLERLRLAGDGRNPFYPQEIVGPTGILKRHYGELLLRLSQHWDVRAFVYDWRKDLKVAAAELHARLRGWFDDDDQVHIVAHGMGGLVARIFIHDFPDRWSGTQDQGQTDGQPPVLGGRLIMLGVPTTGSWVIPRAFAGIDDTLKALDVLHSSVDKRADLLDILSSFPGLYQMLPSPFARQDPAVMKEIERLYVAGTYGDRNVLQAHLTSARHQHEVLSQMANDPRRMVYIAGTNQTTPVYVRGSRAAAPASIADINRLFGPGSYAQTLDGDGFVVHEHGRPAVPEGTKLHTYYVADNHGGLTSHPAILDALDELLATGKTDRLDDPLHSTPPGKQKTKPERSFGASDPVEAFVSRVQTRGLPQTRSPRVGWEERQVEEHLTRNLLTTIDAEEQRGGQRDIPFEAASIDIYLVPGDISKITELGAEDLEAVFKEILIAVPNPTTISQDRSNKVKDLPVDAIAVGHYLGVRPHGAEGDLERAIGAAMGYAYKPEEGGLLTQFSERGIIRGDLGQPFFLTDPRKKALPERVIAIAGMGLPSRFGEPELTVLARELCWSLGRMHKRHLATVLIGAGRGNLVLPQAVSAWIRGIKHAITGSPEDEDKRQHLHRITFVENDPGTIRRIHGAFKQEVDLLTFRNRLQIRYFGPSDKKLAELEEQAAKQAYDRLVGARGRREGDSDGSQPWPTRVTVTVERKVYRFGAITSTAAIPEREVPLDPTLVERANDELAAEWDADKQMERGRFLAQLLVPQDLRTQLSSDSPLVLLLDATTARIHWEVMAQQQLTTSTGNTSPGAQDDKEGYFLGTQRGLTRQLRTTFSPPPEPPPPPRRILRVLVVADPAADHRLPGAEAEGVEVADLFEAFNKVHAGSENRVEVIRYFGPNEATRTTVLRELMLHSYDVLHFCGHCSYDPEQPVASGWIFTDGARVSANELKRIDRVPKFIFSNACESGITPDRSEERTVELAPSFAESFFERGVSNFVCTAWPVDDACARQFALRLYSGLLGVQRNADDTGYEARPLECMYEAMREARRAIQDAPGGIRTWGAYQHYGNPYLRFFSRDTMYSRLGLDAQAQAVSQADSNDTPTAGTTAMPTAAAATPGEAQPASTTSAAAPESNGAPNI